MATIQQRSTARKFIYFALIVALFTVSFAHRKIILASEAGRLGLREVEKGEVKLTDEAIRLSVTGVRGLAVCILWNIAIEQQKRHEWNELEKTVVSITKLQPHFVTPWLYQSWNISFNVSVECDRPRDKYYFIARGAELLVEGERRNQGNDHPDPARRTPANPEMRQHIGIIYQLKIGQGDEKRYLMSLFDLSCIDPKDRAAERFRKAGKSSDEIDLKEFELFCQDHPRLIRRLREQLSMQTPADIVAFLKDNKDVPSRFADTPTPKGQPSLLKSAEEQFPYLPLRRLDETWPNPESPNYEGKDVDAFVVTQTWYGYAQEPLPPETTEIRPGFVRWDPRRYRTPKMMAMLLFRAQPSRAQRFVAEEGWQGEGWFDGSGWAIRDWFEEPDYLPLAIASLAPPLGACVSLLPRDSTELPRKEHILVVGRRRFDSADAWTKHLEMFLAFGARNGLYLDPTTRADWEKQKAQNEKGEAAQKLFWNQHYRTMTNFDNTLYTAMAERTAPAIQAKQKFFLAERARKDQGNPRLALTLYRQGLEEWADVMMANPTFAQIDIVQEDAYEYEKSYLLLWQRQRKEMLIPLVTGMAQIGGFIHPTWPPRIVPVEKSPKRILPLPAIYGPLGQTYWRPARSEPAVMLVGQPGGIPPLPLLQQPTTISIRAPRGSLAGTDWRPLIQDGIVNPPPPPPAEKGS